MCDHWSISLQFWTLLPWKWCSRQSGVFFFSVFLPDAIHSKIQFVLILPKQINRQSTVVLSMMMLCWNFILYTERYNFSFDLKNWGQVSFLSVSLSADGCWHCPHGINITFTDSFPEITWQKRSSNMSVAPFLFNHQSLINRSPWKMDHWVQ